MSEITEQSIFHIPNALATLANETAIPDLTLFLKTLELWNAQKPDLYVYTTTSVEEWLKKQSHYSGKIHTRVALDSYMSLNRQQMERTPSRRGLSNLFHDFTQEKCDLMEWALATSPNGVLFCDADILWLQPLPQIPNTATLALSPHMIRKSDEAKYGEFNAGFLWTNNKQMPSDWREACKTSRFFEQAALETLSDNTPEAELYRFPAQVNYGWWRLFQGDTPYSELARYWSASMEKGVCYKGLPMVCVHTHWETSDIVTKAFNKFLLRFLNEIKKSPKVKKLISYLPLLL